MFRNWGAVKLVRSYTPILRVFSTSGRRPNLTPLPKLATSPKQLGLKSKSEASQEEAVQAELAALRKKFSIKPSVPQTPEQKAKNDYNPLKSLANSKIANLFGVSKFLSEKNQQAESFIKRQAESTSLPAEVRDVQQAMTYVKPNTHLDRHYNSEYFLSVWDPSVRTGELEAALEKSGTSLKDMDLTSMNLLGTQVNIRKRVQQPNRVTLLFLVSSAVPLHIAQNVQSVWYHKYVAAEHALQYQLHQQKSRHNASSSSPVQPVIAQNADGKVINQCLLLNVNDGLLSNVISKSIASGLAVQTSTELHGSTVLYFARAENEPILKARRYVDALNRFMVHMYLLDSKGRVRWKAGLGQEADEEFVNTLFKVTDDLILETQYNEAN